MLKFTSTTLRLAAVLRNNTKLPVRSISKLLDVKKPTNCQFNKFASKVTPDIYNHQPTSPPTTTKPTDEAHKILSKDGELICEIEKLVQINKQTKPLIKLILERSQIFDISTLKKLGLAKFKNSAIRDIKNNPQLYEKFNLGNLENYEFSPGTDMFFNNLFEQFEVTTDTVISRLIESKKLVDKTEFIETLLTSENGEQIIVVRPRRFGKTLFLHTIAEVCKGGKQQKKLFKDYFIGQGNYDWQKYPVIFLTLSELPLESIQECKYCFRDTLNDIAIKNHLQLRGRSVKNNWKFLIQDLSEKTNRNVVVLIDEFDTPILRSKSENRIARKEITLFIREILEICKLQANFIKLLFVTGITTCALTDIYSGPNQLSKRSYDDEFSTVFGFTESEIKKTFKTDIEKLTKRFNDNYNKNVTADDMMIMLKKKYNGYHFSINGESVYNPFSIYQCFKRLRLNDYWYNSNQLTSYFADQIIQNPDQYQIIKKVPLNFTEKELEMEKVQKNYFKQVLLQAGYLTLNYNKESRELKLNWPNEEVQNAFEETLMTSFFKKNMQLIKNGPEIISDLENSNINSFLKAFNLLLPLCPSARRPERFHHQLMFRILKQIGLNPASEYRLKNNKKLDKAFTVGN